jgi:hypothetical protein
VGISLFSNGTCVLHPGVALQADIKDGAPFDITTPAVITFILDEPSFEPDPVDPIFAENVAKD